MYKVYKKDLIAKRLSFIMYANICFIATNSIANHTIKGLVQALKVEKRKQNCGKRLNIIREEDYKPQLFSPSKVLYAKAYSNKKKSPRTGRTDLD